MTGPYLLPSILMYAMGPNKSIVTPGSKAKPNAYSMCAHESSLHAYRTENGYRITNV
jgi:hypothetical protein